MAIPRTYMMRHKQLDGPLSLVEPMEIIKYIHGEPMDDIYQSRR